MIQAEAKRLSQRKYVTIIRYEPDTDGTEAYFAFHPDFEGCMAQGRTPKEARENLDAAREDIIAYLLENDLPVPEPQPLIGKVLVEPSADKQPPAVQAPKIDSPTMRSLQLQPA
jgi:predicted RNase H-like HicB family nuclease